MLKTFKTGGVHPPGNKELTKSPIVRLPLPEQVTIFLSQHLGSPAELVVNVGDEVKVGTLLARSSGFVSAPVHSSVSGCVKKIEEVADTTGYKQLAIRIETAGDNWEEEIDRSEMLKSECGLSGKEILDKIAAAGIVGLGGATFPTHIKLTPPSGMKAEILIINGAECEPYLNADYSLMLAKGAEIIVGIRLLMKALQVEKAVIGIEDNKKDAIASISKLLHEDSRISVCPLKTKYPQGGEKQLIQAVTGRQVSSGQLPVSVGAVVQNVGTVFAVYEAVQKNKPLIERVVTITGKSVVKPLNAWTRIGTSVEVLIRTAGELPENTGKVIVGGPMMGKALSHINVPVTKGCSGVLILPKDESWRKPARNCIRCAKCVFVCPMGLSPCRLTTDVEFENWEQAEKSGITDCLECGSCSYVCPANRPLLDYIRSGKKSVLNLIKNRK